ncbi:UvrB/UvrC motif-containing protein [Candidatus Saccharibacteria bacterium]|nr:UvrB/UvrC motif-containing protein [Candidatus Saccharibacteria bacterium]
MNKQLATKLKTLPNTPGVYFHKDSSGEIIYIGKAANLKNRVRQYFQSSKRFDNKTLSLVEEIVDTDWREVETELDALFLESEMIKRYLPKFNVLLRDDKSHTYIRIDFKNDWPTVTFTRNPLDDGADYYGPYYAGSGVKQAMQILRRIFPYFTKLPKTGQRPSLDAHIGLEPDRAKVTSAEYKRHLHYLVRLMRGERLQLIKDLEKAMGVAAARQDYEQAKLLRDQILTLKELRKRIIFGDKESIDISKDQALADLQQLLNLPKLPARIEGYDVSHQSGTNVAASMVVFKNGASSRADYRKFKLYTTKNDDYAGMREVITRRLKHLDTWGKPDLIIIDGGQGQLNAVADLLQAEKIPYIGRNKSGDHTRNADTQLIFPCGDGHYTTSVAQSVHIVKLIARIDEESHRFAVSYHTALKRKNQVKSVLDDIPGVGVKTKATLKKLGGVARLRTMSETELAKHIGKARAKAIKNVL